MSTPPTANAELRRGWPLVLAAAVGVGTGRSPLPIYSLSVFTKSIAAEFGWGRGEVQAMLAFGTMGVLIGSPLVGALMDRRPVRTIVLVSTVAFAITFGLIGPLTHSVVTFYALVFIASVVGAGTLPVTWSRAIFDWFVTKRGLALGFALMGSGFAAFLVPPYATWLLTHVGWRMGYVGLALLPLLLSLPLSYLFLKPPPEKYAGGPQRQNEIGMTLKQAASTLRFWVLSVSFFLASFSTGGITAHLVPMLTDHGYSLQRAAVVAGTQGLAVIGGRAITGYLLDKVWAPALAAVVLALPTASCFVLAAGVSDPTIATAAVILVGFAAGAEFDLVAYLTARYFGMRHFGALYGVLYAVFVSASGFAPGIFGKAFDMAGNYTLILNVAAAALAGSAVIVLFLGRYPSEYAPAK